jgi:hypothetical protein
LIGRNLHAAHPHAHLFQRRGVAVLVYDFKFAHTWDDDPVVRGTSTGLRGRRWLLENESFSKIFTKSK